MGGLCEQEHNILVVRYLHIYC